MDIKIDDYVQLKDGRIAVVRSTYKYNTFTNYSLLTDKIEMLNMNIYDKDELFVKIKKTKEIEDKFKSFLHLDKMRNLYWGGGHLGSDPEIFVVNKKTNEVIPAFNFLRGKTNPDKVGSYINGQGYGQNLFWDGFQAEFNTEASNCMAWVCDSVHNGLRTLAEKAKAHDKNAVLTIKSTLDIPIDMLMESDNEHVEFGCMPSLNAYNMQGYKANGRDVPFRSAGGHIHFGIAHYLGDDKKKILSTVKALDKILGVACVSLFANYDSADRRVLYGLAGEYRLPKHGLEYRVLSNAWMSHPLIMNIVYELSRQVIAVDKAGLIDHWDATEEETIECINTCNVELARKILKRNKIMFKNIMYSKFRNEEKASSVYKIFLNGMESIIDDPNDVEGNWFKNYVGHCEGTGHNIAHMAQLTKYGEILALEE